jgi:protein-S-isoprenylcysteine O-methyltransferase Ste14
MGFFGYNMRENRPVIGDREPALCDPSFTIGLCLRKAISYAMDREEMNNIIHGGEFEIVNHPIYQKHGVWCNPDIIVYNHDLEEAQKYMAKIGGGFPCAWTPTTDLPIISVLGVIAILFTTVNITYKIKKRRGKN